MRYFTWYVFTHRCVAWGVVRGDVIGYVLGSGLFGGSRDGLNGLGGVCSWRVSSGLEGLVEPVVVLVVVLVNFVLLVDVNAGVHVYGGALVVEVVLVGFDVDRWEIVEVVVVGLGLVHGLVLVVIVVVGAVLVVDWLRIVSVLAHPRIRNPIRIAWLGREQPLDFVVFLVFHVFVVRVYVVGVALVEFIFVLHDRLGEISFLLFFFF